MLKIHNLKNGFYSSSKSIKLKKHYFSLEYKYYKYPAILFLENDFKDVLFINRSSESIDIIEVIYLTDNHTIQYIIECSEYSSIYSIISIEIKLYDNSKINKQIIISNIDIYSECVNPILDNIEKLILINDLFECDFN